ncbi:MAG: YHYH protein, partial [Crocinitomicaceae bacterium]|nr:YHYH protein [Crocinitomicaceae bacterium]
MNKLKLILILFFFSAIAIKSFSHNQNYDKVILHEWTVNENTKIKASFLMFKNDEVYLQKDNSETVHFPLADFSSADQQYIMQRYNRIQKLNSQYISATVKNKSTDNTIDFSKILVTAFALFLILSLTYFLGGKNKVRYISYFSAVAFLAVIYSFQIKSTMQTNSVTDPLSVDSAFTPFKPNIVTSWDSNYFYVESFGIPTTHNMMTGITSWQQQVPIPQCYIKPNAWMIPLNPVVAAVPVPVDSIHFTRGAIAVAINGIPIFNYHTNTGVDAYLDGQLDQWGGHCGRADDYHYHIAPMQLYSNTPNNMPIAYALDGFAVYGTVEPDGSALLPLDANHGHYWTNGVYHYHGTATPV